MISITIEATTPSDKELLTLMRDHLCYAITDEALFKLRCNDWNGRSGGDDAYFGLENKTVEVKIR